VPFHEWTGAADHVDTIAGFNVDHVTITINMVDPEIGAKIYPWVFWKHKRYTGVEAAKLLTDASSKDWKCSPSGAFSAKSIQS